MYQIRRTTIPIRELLATPIIAITTAGVRLEDQVMLLLQALFQSLLVLMEEAQFVSPLHTVAYMASRLLTAVSLLRLHPH